jgi:hypothetical protein
MPKTIGIAGVTVYETNEAGKVTRAITSANLDTTADTYAPGCILTDSSTGYVYFNAGTLASPSWNKMTDVTTDEMPSDTIKTAVVTISAADIVATGAGKFGHASGYPLVADPGAGKVVQLVDAILSYTHDTAAFTGGGNTTININGGAAVTGVIANSAFAAAAASSITELVPLATAGNVKTANKGLNLVTASAFTQPGTAAGTIKAIVHYRIVTL